MCGIAGLVSSLSAEESRSIVARMTSTLTHRGPDNGDFFIENQVALGHRRLAVIDLTDAANQPMTSADGNAILVFNGEIYNFRELRKSLSERGRTIRGSSDTAVLLEAWCEFGPGCVERLRGMFAFAVYDKSLNLVFLARDRLGKKPLFYATGEGWFGFGSEIKALLASGLVCRQLDEQALVEYFCYGYPLGGRTMYTDIRSLPPGNMLSISLDQGPITCHPHRYWHFELQPDPLLEEAGALSRLHRVLGESVRLRMVSDVPVGVFLSGGIDSSIIAAMMREQSDEKVRTFNIGFQEKQYDESAKAAAVARRLGTEHCALIATPEIIVTIPELLAIYDQPFGDSSSIPMLLLSRFTREHATVALSGDGGDELFAGYTRYLKTNRMHQIAGWLNPLGLSLMGKLAGTLAAGTSGRRTLERICVDPSLQYDHALGRTTENLSLLRHEILRAAGPPVRQPVPLRVANLGQIESYQLADLYNFLPEDILVKIDRASMHYSLEARCPFLDQEVVAFAATLPMGLKVRRRQGKYLLKQMAARYIGEDLASLPKRGFAVPIARWLRSELAVFLTRMLADSTAVVWRYCRHDVAASYISRHGHAGFDFSVPLWRLLLFYEWSKRDTCSG